jgi:hypothetical protein
MSETPDPLAHACELVGRLFYHFSRMELQLDAAIAKLFKLDPLYAPIVTANMSFMKKIDTVRCALSQGKFSIDAEKTINAIISINEKQRVVAAHYAFDPIPGGVEFAVEFARVTAKKELGTKSDRWTETQFRACFKQLEQLESDLKRIISELEPEKVVWPPGGYISSTTEEALHQWYRQRAAKVAQMAGGLSSTPISLEQAGKDAPRCKQRKVKWPSGYRRKPESRRASRQ